MISGHQRRLYYNWSSSTVIRNQLSNFYMANLIWMEGIYNFLSSRLLLEKYYHKWTKVAFCIYFFKIVLIWFKCLNWKGTYECQTLQVRVKYDFFTHCNAAATMYWFKVSFGEQTRTLKSNLPPSSCTFMMISAKGTLNDPKIIVYEVHVQTNDHVHYHVLLLQIILCIQPVAPGYFFLLTNTL